MGPLVARGERCRAENGKYNFVSGRRDSNVALVKKEEKDKRRRAGLECLISARRTKDPAFNRAEGRRRRARDTELTDLPAADAARPLNRPRITRRRARLTGC